MIWITSKTIYFIVEYKKYKHANFAKCVIYYENSTVFETYFLRAMASSIVCGSFLPSVSGNSNVNPPAMVPVTP